MSMENAILTHAAALEKLAAALDHAAALEKLAAALALLTGTRVDMAKVSVIADAAGANTADVVKAAAQVEQMGAKGGVKKDAELDKAVGKVEDDAKAEKGKAASAASSQTAGADSSEDDAPALDYVKDVRPVLLAAIKKAGKEKVQELVSSFGVDKADKIDPAQYAELLASAQKLAA